ncbi:uncharacterized protein BO87DRAFT_210729 [Aspergillus neoniger CBS 115656]|uniref:Uncharacterized protein n=1 Tax=Aspergillus neoniger (strain CBS 115656) TaxID=1448310 RepID=A0A318YK63_ASPNB|nr:hypothetical protein BO87DRAFT_210729 [Aspergillus neoniger CBS 115656]PYH28678.1 hypothetical protein BO87DRAFT_210729 [Aspergillus neoniger CBS 115656]
MHSSIKAEREKKAKRNNTTPNPGSDSPRLIKHLWIFLIQERGIGLEASIIFSTFC